jgi:transcriptional regulator with XRE-family HTH domain
MLRLKEWRERRGLTVRKLGELSGVHFVNVAKFEAGKGDPQLSTVLKLCEALGVTLNQLVIQRKHKGGK